ncbi:MAG: hypothetical protein VX694_09030 [Planctomycetota bacterium]|nr:hypothetical protein [Planctomycetota bacterium]
MNEDQATPEVVQRKKGSTPDWLKFLVCLVLVLLSPLILYLLTLIVIGLFAFGEPLGFFIF